MNNKVARFFGIGCSVPVQSGFLRYAVGLILWIADVIVF